MRGRRECPLEELAGDDVGEARLGAFAGEDGVAPRPLVLAGLVEVEREERGLLVGVVAGSPLERMADAAVDLPPSPERQPLVGRSPDEVVPERERVAVGRER